MLAEHAPAKVNLTLHVVGCRADGYHLLESLVAFAGVGDALSLEPGERLSLSVEGDTAGEAGPEADNLVLRAARALAALRPGLKLGHFHLHKELPVAAGLGGGSADAAAALRLLARVNHVPPGDPALFEAAQASGADVPVCVDPRARMMAGIGERVSRPLGLPPLPALLVNPRVPCPTAPVFAALGLAPGATSPGPPHPLLSADQGAAPLLASLRLARNDLEPPARALVPDISSALDLLAREPGCRLARMSGSGATVFGLFDGEAAAARAEARILLARPAWWARATLLR